MALQLLWEQWYRLNRVSYRILSKATSLCGDRTRYIMGFYFGNRYSFGEDFVEAAHSLGLSEPFQILQVVKNSPAEQGGIQKGDLLLSINGQPVPSGKEAHQKFSEQLKELSQNGSAVSITVLRKRKEVTTVIHPEVFCDYQVKMLNQDVVNAFADGNNIVLFRGMMRFVEDDIELGFIVSHELAHNTQKHIHAKMANAFSGWILDLAIAVLTGVNTHGLFSKLAANAYSKGFEAEADYVGLYMMALSDMDIEKAPNFWRRMAASFPESINTNHTASHPPTPERFLALEKAVKEIHQKIANGLPLRPEMKE
ncbi:MAG: M48 family metalloprotease [Nitrospinales bacterium]